MNAVMNVRVPYCVEFLDCVNKCSILRRALLRGFFLGGGRRQEPISVAVRIWERLKPFRREHKIDRLCVRNAVSEVCTGWTEGKGEVHPCARTEALYRPYGP